MDDETKTALQEIIKYLNSIEITHSPFIEIKETPTKNKNYSEKRYDLFTNHEAMIIYGKFLLESAIDGENNKTYKLPEDNIHFKSSLLKLSSVTLDESLIAEDEPMKFGYWLKLILIIVIIAIIVIGVSS